MTFPIFIEVHQVSDYTGEPFRNPTAVNLNEVMYITGSRIALSTGDVLSVNETYKELEDKIRNQILCAKEYIGV